MHHATELFAPVAACVDLRTLLVLMLLEAGRVEEARVLAGRPSVALTRDEESNVVERVASRLAPYHRARGGLVDPRVLEGRFEEAFGRSWGARPSGRDESSAPRDAAGERLLLPRCTSVYACPSCPCRPWCRLDEWYRLARHLQRHLLPARLPAVVQ